jgi:hypothetical protein
VLPELRKVLAGCAAFASHEALAAIFADPHLQPWRQRLPQVTTVEQRVNQVIALLQLYGPVAWSREDKRELFDAPRDEGGSGLGGAK